MLRFVSAFKIIVLSAAVSTSLLVASAVRAQGSNNAISCPQMPAGVPATNIPQAPAPRQAHRWAPAWLQESGRFHVVSSPRFLARVRQDDDKQVIFLFGTFTREDEGAIMGLSRLLVPGKNTVVSFNFGGGTGGAIFAFHDLIRSKCNKDSGCVLRTEVASGNRCGSFCIALFMMGDVRVADADAEFGFHAATIGYCKIPGDAERTYKLAGVSAEWLDAHPGYFLERDVTWLKPPQMSGSNIVTIIATKKH